MAHIIKSNYDKASIPTVSITRIVQLVKAYNDKYSGLMRSYIRDKETPNFVKKIDVFKMQGAKSFDVSACKCVMNVNCVCKKNPDSCECSIQINSSCQKSNKIPLIEQRFVYLQKELRMGKIGTVDKKDTI